MVGAAQLDVPRVCEFALVFLLGVDGYSLLLERGFPLAAASAYLSNTSRSTILPIKYRTGYGVASIFSDFLQLQLGALWPENATTTQQLGIELMGDAAFMDAIQVERDMGIGDGVVLPIAFALLALMVRSARVLLLVVLSLVVSALVALGSMFGVTFAIDVMSATMSLMMSLAIALSIDYGLFLSVTFRESLAVAPIRARRWPTRCRRRATRFWSAASR